MQSAKNFRILKFKSKPILKIGGISKSYGNRMVLKKIDIVMNNKMDKVKLNFNN